MRAALPAPLPESVAIGAGNAILVRGTFDPEGEPFSGLALQLGEGIPRAVDSIRAGSGLEWWALVTIPPSQATGTADLTLVATTAGAGTVELPLGRIELAEQIVPDLIWERIVDPPPREPLVAICMATYEPDPERFAAQLASIRVQSHPNWRCVISDDASSPEAVALIEELTDDDDRFLISRAPANLGFYANFERAMAMAPAGAALVTMADQDDVWRADKLERMVAVLEANPGAILAYSDMRVVDGAGRVISETFWYESDNAFTDIGTLAIINTIFGVASLFRRELLELILPLPPAFSGEHYHDHWIALCARAAGEIVYLDEPTYDYVRHSGSVTMNENTAWAPPSSSASRRASVAARRLLRRVRLGLTATVWRDAYFERYLLIRQFAAVLELRAGWRMTPAQRRSLRLLDAADRSPRAFSWLLARTLRPLLGHHETLGRERVLAGAILWRRLAARRRGQRS